MMDSYFYNPTLDNHFFADNIRRGRGRNTVAFHDKKKVLLKTNVILLFKSTYLVAVIIVVRNYSNHRTVCKNDENKYGRASHLYAESFFAIKNFQLSDD